MSIAKIKNTDYNLQTYCGDSGSIKLSGLSGITGATLYFEIKGNQSIIKEIALTGVNEVYVNIDVADTEALGVGSWEYGVKICKEVESGVYAEDTVIPKLGTACGCNKALFIVNEKRVEGY